MEEVGIPEEQIDEFIANLPAEVTQPTVGGDNQVEVLKTAFVNERDWRKRAAIAARIISLNLE